MPGRIAVEPSPIAGLLRRLQGSAGWGSFVDDDLKQRMVRQLERIALDDDTPAQTQVAAIACTMRASALELEAVNTFARLYEATELERRIDELSRRLEPVAMEPEFVDLVELTDTGSRDDIGPAPDDGTEPAVEPEPVPADDQRSDIVESESVGLDDLFDD